MGDVSSTHTATNHVSPNALQVACSQRARNRSQQVTMVKGLWFDLWLSFMVYLHVRLGLWLDYGWIMVMVLQNMWGLWLVLFACLTKKTTHTVETLKLPTSLAVLSFMLCWTRPSKAIFGLFLKRLWTYFLKWNLARSKPRSGFTQRVFVTIVDG